MLNRFFGTEGKSSEELPKPAAGGPVDFELPTAPMPLELAALERPLPAQQREEALSAVERHHSRIANTIRTLWCYPECGNYINKLIMAGGDGMGQSRVGFHQDAVRAMLALSDLHDGQFGPSEIDPGLNFLK